MEAVSLVGRALNLQEKQYALQSFERHFAMSNMGFHDGRHYFIVRDGAVLVGITGHHWSWGPKENVWLGWFAVELSRQGGGLGSSLLAMTEQEARELGYKTIFVETYDHPDFKRTIDFYIARGFKRVGGIECWLSGGEAMVVLSKVL
jgi:GNAT superfamily N-acetyltransferase